MALDLHPKKALIGCAARVSPVARRKGVSHEYDDKGAAIGAQENLRMVGWEEKMEILSRLSAERKMGRLW